MDKWIKKSHPVQKQKRHSEQPIGMLACTLKQDRINCPICSMTNRVFPTWLAILCKEFSKEYFKNILAYLHTNTFYPPPENVFEAFSHFELHETRVVILGQDPYHGSRQAMGLAFSVNHGVTIPPSLRNIFKEIDSTIGYPLGLPSHGSLLSWAEQGVLLLNTTLTVAPSSPGSHYALGWHNLTDATITAVNERTAGTVFMLWGADAARKRPLINCNKHLVLVCPHPSPFSAHKGFFGCDHFRKANTYLKGQNKIPIDWTKSD